MSTDRSAKGNLDGRDGAAFPTPEQRFFEPQFAKDGVVARADAVQTGPAAMGADVDVQGPAAQGFKLLLGRVRAGLVLLRCAFQLRVLRLQIVALELKCRVLRLQEPDVLTKYRRTAVLVDELSQEFKWSHGLPLRWVPSEKRRVYGAGAMSVVQVRPDRSEGANVN